MTDRYKHHLQKRAATGDQNAIFQLDRAGIPIEVDDLDEQQPYRAFDDNVPRVAEPEYRSPRLILPQWQKM